MSDQKHEKSERYRRLVRILKKKYGYSSFRPGQYEIIRQVTRGHDVLAILPTGYGKSLTYQLPALYSGQPAVVVSPLISLMDDQREALRKIGVKSCAYNSTVPDRRAMLDKIERGKYRVIYITPESLAKSGVREGLKRLNEEIGISVIAIDEAHCISSYGFDFRADYRKLSELRDHFPEVPILAVTATATEEVADDIASVLQMEIKKVYRSSFDRPNLYLQVQRKRNGEKDILSILNEHGEGSAIVYCLTRAKTEDITKMLRSHGIPAGYYHGGASDERKKKTHLGFLSGKLRVVVGTIAFGMGIDKPDVRTVIHYGCPRNLEGYYQEIGRAGRDGLPSQCYLIYDFGDFRTQQHFIADKKDDSYRQTLIDLLRIMQNYVSGHTCRRVTLLEYFGENYAGPCQNCDNCTGGTCLTEQDETQQDVEDEARTLIGLIQSIPDQKYGKTMWVNILRGSKAKTITKTMMKNTFYASGKGRSAKWWKELCEVLIEGGLLRQVCLGGGFNSYVIAPTSAGLNWFYGREESPMDLTAASMTVAS